jgi:hypothetical protein
VSTLLLALLLVGCTLARVTRPDGTTITAFVLGNGHVDASSPRTAPVAGNADGLFDESPMGAFVGTRIVGGQLSSAVVSIVSFAATAAVAIFTKGAF